MKKHIHKNNNLLIGRVLTQAKWSELFFPSNTFNNIPLKSKCILEPIY